MAKLDVLDFLRPDHRSADYVRSCCGARGRRGALYDLSACGQVLLGSATLAEFLGISAHCQLLWNKSVAVASILFWSER